MYIFLVFIWLYFKWTVWDDCRCATTIDAEDAAALLLGNVNVSFTTTTETLTSVSTVAATVTPRMVGGFCTKECGLPMWVFLTLLFFSVVASFASGIPSQQVKKCLTEVVDSVRRETADLIV